MEALLWMKPRRVVTVSGQLLADFAGASAHPLSDATKRERALRAFVKVRSDEDACAFTEAWGLLYVRVENGQRNAFPIDRFYLERQYLLCLMGAGLRAGDARRITEALRACGDGKKKLAATLEPDTWQESLTDKEQVLVTEGLRRSHDLTIFDQTSCTIVVIGRQA